MRVFVSSTCYDLVDVRAEVTAHLRQLGIQPVLSDDKLSDFVVPPDQHSIQACLVNIERCDSVVLILDKRYGPSLKRTGIADISATHAEYRHAIKIGKAVHVYARDRLIADHRVWSGNRDRENLELAWVKEVKDRRLFDLLDEHAKLEVNLQRSNWYHIFSSSVDLKASLSKLFEQDLLQQRVVELIEGNRFPVIRASAEFDGSKDPRGVQHFVCRIELKNAGGAPAMDFSVKWDDQQQRSRAEILTPGESYPMTSTGFGGPVDQHTKILHVEYASAVGVKVVDHFKLSIDFRGHDTLYGVHLQSRRYVRSKTPTITIDTEST